MTPGIRRFTTISSSTQIDLEMEPASNFLQQLRSGDLRAYAVAAKTRLATAPDVPTADEAGLPGFYRSIWIGLWLPKGAPGDIASRLNAAVQVALAEPKLRTRIAELGQEIFPPEQQTPEALAALQAAEIAKWWPVIKQANIKGE